MNKNINNSIQRILQDNEKIIWYGKPDLFSMFFSSILLFILFFVSLLISISLFKYISFLSILIYIPFIRPFINFLNGCLSRYCITSMRIIMKTGIIGDDISSVYFDNIINIFVKVGLVGKLFNSGILIVSSRAVVDTTFIYIKKPYDISKTLQEILNDRKNAQYSGRKDLEDNHEDYSNFIKEVERIKKDM